jgi:hypothetical protein
MFGKLIDQGLGSMAVALIGFALLAAPAWADDGGDCTQDCVDGSRCVNGVCTPYEICVPQNAPCTNGGASCAAGGKVCRTSSLGCSCQQ